MTRGLVSTLREALTFQVLTAVPEGQSGFTWGSVTYRGKMSRSPFQQCFCKILARSVEHLLRHLKYKELKRNWPPALYLRLTKHLKVSDVVWHYTLLHINAEGQRPASLPGTASGNKARPLSMYTLLKKTKQKTNISSHLDEEEHMEAHSLWCLQKEEKQACLYSLNSKSWALIRVTQSEGDFRRFRIQWAERPLRAFVWRNVPVRVSSTPAFTASLMVVWCSVQTSICR